jgi:hypothetical protein
MVTDNTSYISVVFSNAFLEDNYDRKAWLETLIGEDLDFVEVDGFDHTNLWHLYLNIHLENLRILKEYLDKSPIFRSYLYI